MYDRPIRQRSFVVSTEAITTPDGSVSPYHQIAEWTFDSHDDLRAGLGSKEGQVTAGDLRNFASAGVTLVIYETRET